MKDGFRYGKRLVKMEYKVLESYHMKHNFSMTIGLKGMGVGGNGREMVRLPSLSSP